MYSVERVDLVAQLEKIYRLRVSAWQARVPHFPDIAAWTDEFDSVGLHWAIWSGDQPIAAARLTIHDRLQQVPHPEVFAPVLPPDLPGPIAVLTRLVVGPDHGGKGLSRLLDEVRIAHATQMGCQHVIGSTYAGQKRLAAMQAMGFEILGEAGLYASGPLRAVGANGGGRREIAFIRPTV